MSRFAVELRLTAQRLDLPQPARSRVLLELAADMDDLFRHLRAGGLDDATAHRDVLQDFDLSDEAIAELAQVHRGPARRLLDRLPVRSLKLWERALLVVMMAATLHTGGWLTRTAQVVRDAGPYVWPMMLLGAGILGLAVRKTYQFFIKQDHATRRLRTGLTPVLGLSVTAIFLGFALPWLDVFVQIREATAASLPAAAAMMQWTIGATAVLQLGLGLGLAGAMSWFGLAQKVLRIEQHETEVLLNLPHPESEELTCN